VLKGEVQGGDGYEDREVTCQVEEMSELGLWR
jgi:hypothetical protein